VAQVIEAITPLLKSQQTGYRLVSARVKRLEGRVAMLEAKLQSIELPPARPPTTDETAPSG
jgi:hypothetical protein